MVMPVHNIKFKISLEGAEFSGEGHMVEVKDMETISISIDNTVSSWSPLDTQGWAKRFLTSKSITISLSGKRNYDCPGNNSGRNRQYERTHSPREHQGRR